MMRMHFSADDLARTRVAATWGPWAETVLSLGRLRDRRTAAPSALRAAGLASSRRERNRVVHATTDLGGRLLERSS